MGPHPRVHRAHRGVAADRVQQAEAARPQAAVHDLHVGPVVVHPDVLEHADRDHPVEASLDLAVVLQADLDRQAAADLARELDLALGNRDPRHPHPVGFSGVAGEPAPAAADVEDPHPGL